MSNSPLVVYTALSPNCSTRTAKIDRITIHHMAGVGSVESCGNVFASSARQASSNYGIGNDGRIGLYVPEEKRAWTSSSTVNDNRAVTIEVSNSAVGEPWPVSDAAYKALIDLCVDICQRNGIKRLNYTGDTSGNLTAHRWFAPTSCPGQYLYERFSAIAEEVNQRLEDEDMTGEEIYKRLMDYLAPLPPSGYAKETCERAVKSKLFMDGDGDGSLDRPRTPVTREEFATVLERAGILK